MSDNHETYEILLVKAVDDRLTPEEEALFQTHLQSCESCQEELADFKSVKKTTDTIRARILQDARVEPIKQSLAARSTFSLGLFLLFAGSILLIGGSLYQLMESDAPLWAKWGVGLGGTGLLVAFGQILVSRLRGQAYDPYKDIDM